MKQQLLHTFRSLEHRNFRLYYFGQIISVTGTWMQNLAISWLVYKLTKSAFYLGLLSFASFSPMLFFGLFGGALADHFNRKKLFISTQFAALLCAALLTWLTFNAKVEVWQLLGLVFFLGFVNAVDMPTRQSLVADLVDKKNLVNAITLCASLFHFCRTIGPAIAGYLVSLSGEGLCFLVNTLSYIPVLAILFVMRVSKYEHHVHKETRSFQEAIRYCQGSNLVIPLLCLTAVTSGLGAQYIVLMPAFVAQILHLGPGTLGFLMAANSVGALLAALFLANRATASAFVRGVGLACFLCASSIWLFSFATNLFLAACAAFLCGFTFTIQLSGTQSLIQLSAPDHLRGRIMSLYNTVLLGIGPFTGLFIGYFAASLGPSTGVPMALKLCGSICAVAAIAYLIRMRNIDMDIVSAPKEDAKSELSRI
jgi:MFS family permease